MGDVPVANPSDRMIPNHRGRVLNLLTLGAALISLAIILLTAMRDHVGFDVYWHLKMGQDWLSRGLSPWIDHYSFTYLGAVIKNPPVMFQALLYGAVQAFGEDWGFRVVRLFAYLLVLLLSGVLLRQVRASAWVYVIVLSALVFVLQMRPPVRPELFSYGLSLLALLLYQKAGSSFNWRGVLSMIALIWFWCWYHSPVIGYVIFAGYFLDCAIAQFRSRSGRQVWLSWLAAGAAMLGVSFLVPGFHSPLHWIISSSADWRPLIKEYAPLDPDVLSLAEMYGLLFVGIGPCVLAVLNRKAGFVLICVVLTYAGFTMQRMVTPAGVVNILIAGLLLGSMFSPDRLPQTSRQRAKFVAVLLTVPVFLLASFNRAQYSVSINWGAPTRYPVALVDYLTQIGFRGKVLNDYGIGGFLIHRMAPDMKVFIDGRTAILYPVEHLREHQDLMVSSEKLREALDKYEMDGIIHRFPDASEIIQQSGGFSLEFVDLRHGFWTRGSGNLHAHGALVVRPACWTPDLIDQLQRERAAFLPRLPPLSPLVPFSNLVSGFADSADGKQYFDEQINQEVWSDEMRRFAAFRLMELGRDDLAVMLFGSVEDMTSRDVLAAAVAGAGQENYQLVSDILDDLALMDWPTQDTSSQLIEFRLHEWLADHLGSDASHEARVRQLGASLDEKGLGSAEIELGAQAFCPHI